MLRETYSGDPKWTFAECALGATGGHAEFNIMRNTQLSSLLAPEHKETAIFQGKNEVSERIQVEIKTLDGVLPSLIDRFGAKSVYLKMDTQGYDLEVIKGAENGLSGIAALQTEASVVKIYEGVPTYYEVIRYLEDRNFALSGIFLNNEGHFPLLVEFDCYMVNRACLSDRL